MRISFAYQNAHPDPTLFLDEVIKSSTLSGKHPVKLLRYITAWRSILNIPLHPARTISISTELPSAESVCVYMCVHKYTIMGLGCIMLSQPQIQTQTHTLYLRCKSQISIHLLNLLHKYYKIKITHKLHTHLFSFTCNNRASQVSLVQTVWQLILFLQCIIQMIKCCKC